MKPNETIRQAPAYRPMFAIVQDALQEVKQEEPPLRTLLFKSAILREFDAGLLARLAEGDEGGAELLEEVDLYVPLEQVDEDTYRYDEFTREALFDAAVLEGQEELLVQASEEVAAYYQELALQTQDEAEKAQYEEQALYYRTLADPEAGFEAWEEAWQALPEGPYQLNRKAELIRQGEYAWADLSDVPGAQAGVLLEKGWLAYNTDDWQGAVDSFSKALKKGSLGLKMRFRLRVPWLRARAIRSSKVRTAAGANLGLGYAYYRQGRLGLAAQRFQETMWLTGKRLAGQETEGALRRAKALCGLGEVCTQMGAPEGILLRRFLLPEEERRKTLLQYRVAAEAPPLEDLALDRLLSKAEQLFEDALKTLPGDESAADDRLRILARKARLDLERGYWESPQALFEHVKREELERLGVDNEQNGSLAEEPRVADRLAWINLYLGDCRLLAMEAPSLRGQELPPKPTGLLQKSWAQLKGDLLERAATRRETKVDLAVEEVSHETAESQARRYYHSAWSVWKKMSKLEGMALSLRRKADVAALDLDDPERREEALHLYAISVDLYERIGNPREIVCAQERIELLRTRTEPPEETGSLADEEMSATESAVAEEPATKMNQAAKRAGSLEEFHKKVEDTLAHRRRFFRYRVARQLEWRLRIIYRVIAALAGLALTGLLCGWAVWLAYPWLSRLSARVTGLPWALPVLGVCWIVGLMILIVENVTFIRRWAVGMIPLRKFWLDQDQVAIDDIGLHLYDDTGQRIESIDWWDVWQVRSLTWQEKERKGGRVAVFGQGGQVIRFDHHLRGYQRLLESIRRYIEITGDADRWQERERAHLVGGFLVWSFLVLNLAVFLACPLALILALIPPITRFGKVAFAALAVIVACYGLAIAGLYFRDWLFVQALRRPRRTVQREVGPEKVWK